MKRYLNIPICNLAELHDVIDAMQAGDYLSVEQILTWACRGEETIYVQSVPSGLVPGSCLVAKTAGDPELGIPVVGCKVVLMRGIRSWRLKRIEHVVRLPDENEDLRLHLTQPEDAAIAA